MFDDLVMLQTCLNVQMKYYIYLIIDWDFSLKIQRYSYISMVIL